MHRMVLLALAGCFSFGFVLADDDTAVAVDVEVISGTANMPAPVYLAGEGSDFQVDELAIGETRTVTGPMGEIITMTRTDEGMTIDMNGETITVPPPGVHGVHMGPIAVEGGDHAMPVTIFGATSDVSVEPRSGVTIISSEPLDASVRESIKSVLISAGNDSEVTFVDGSSNRHVTLMQRAIAIRQQAEE